MKSLDLKNKAKARFFPGLLVLMASALFVIVDGPQALAQSANEILGRVNRLEKEVETLSRAIYRGEKPPAEFNAGSSASADVEIRLQQLEGEVRSLRGSMEEKFFELRELRSQLERMQGDLELRLQQLEGGGSGGGASFSSSSSDPGSAPYTTNNTQSSSSNDGGLGSYVKKPSGSLSSNADDAAIMYENAFSLIKQSQYDAAEREFDAFLKAYPDHALSGNAMYWLGESHYVRGQFEQAARVFAEGYQKYPKGSKSADNLLKLGMALAGLGKTQDACVALGQISKENMAGSAPVMRRAEQEKQRLGC